ncbi:tudor domain-containing protein 1 [Elysia marginata]|uniref:Tudor domain-containing protein 1 n=1 Tax=Elysia marginata TaxID=1093978 RepID=A0AAV4J2I2_9GAST|nr:tudor domain-containing protein 1 [Elysia marginata]
MKCCTYCRKEGCTTVCSRCGLYYCSVECQKLDWPKHKEICAAFSEYYKINGGPNFSNQQQQENGKLSSESDSDFKKKNSYKPFSKKPKSSGRFEKGNHNSQDDSDNRKSRSGQTQQGNGSGPNSVIQPQGNAKGKKSSINTMNQRKSNDRSRPGVHQKEETETKGKDLQSGSAEAGDAGAIPGGAGDASYGHIQMTIPVGSSGKAYLTHYENPNKFWISLVDHLEEFTETTALIAKQEGCSPPAAPKPNEAYGTLWDGEWARLDIVSVSGDEVTVFFVDYGNTGVVKIKDLRPLTVDIKKLPAQALCCCVSKIKPKGPAWSEAAISKVSEWFGPPMSKYFNFELVAKRGSKNAVKVSIDNEALSEMLLSNDLGERDSGEPGLPSITARPNQHSKASRFTVKNLKSEQDSVNVGDQLTTLVLAFECMKKIVAVKDTATSALADLESLMAAEGFAEQPIYRPSAGDVVAAVYSLDKKWYRAQVLTVDGDACSLFFVDYGNAEDQKVENIKEIKNEKIKDIPAQVLLCCLHGLESLPANVTEDIANEFAQLLPNYQVDETWTLLSVKSRKDHCLVVDVVSTKGLSLADALKNKFPHLEIGKAQAQSPQPNKAVTNNETTPDTSLSTTIAGPAKQRNSQKKVMNIEGERLPIDPDVTVSVLVSYVQDCSQFYVRLESKEQKFQVMTAKLKNSVKARPKFQEAPPVGSVVMVQYSVDGQWYRGRVMSMDPAAGGRCKVMFIDYGNCETARWTDLRELDPAVCELPAQAVRCCLAGELEHVERRSHYEFKQYLENETVDVKVVDGDVDSVAVQMFARGTDINNFILGTAAPQTSTVPKINNLVLEPGSSTKVQCVNIVSPAAFYVQVTSQVPTNINLTQDLTTRLAEAPEPVSSVAVGDFVASMFSEDSDVIWYRGRVEKVDGDKVLVYFVDFGNFEERDKAGLMQLSEKDCREPAATLKCQLQGCKSSTPEMDAKLIREGQSQIDSIRVISQTEQGCVVDIVNSEGKCITDLFQHTQETTSTKSRGQPDSKPSSSVKSPTSSSSPASRCLPTESLGDVNSFTEVGVTQVDCFSSIYVTSTDSTQQAKLLEVMLALNEMADSLPKLSEARQGTVCAARFSVDQNWYRARIVSVVSPTSCEVQFVDYGNSEQTLTSELKALTGDERFLELPAQASRGQPDSKPSSSVKSPTSSSSPASQRLLTESLGDGNSFTEVGVTQVDCFSSIYVTSTDSTQQAKLLEVMLALNEMADSLPKLSEARQGTVCAARFSVDQNWYRVRIVSVVSPTSCEVQFVDYGNSEQTLTSELKALTGDERFLELPAQAVKCCLVGFESLLSPGGSREMIESETADLVRLKAELLEKTVKIKVLGKIGETNVVDIENEQQQSISQMFKDKKKINESEPAQ